jgi:hypothetical protein
VVGFLARIGVREASPPRDPLGITCPACHASHGPSSDHSLLRTVPLPSRFAKLDAERDAPTRICIACHAPQGDEVYASQSAALLWWGDESPRGASPHRAVPGGCIGCHMRAGSQARPDGSGHAFRADRAACAECHPNGQPEERKSPAGSISDRARAVWARLTSLGVVAKQDGEPPHALGAGANPPNPEPLHRAAKNARLVLEDPAAWVHNGPFARALLDEAERALEASRP